MMLPKLDARWGPTNKTRISYAKQNFIKKKADFLRTLQYVLSVD
ncbi:hypothetical protein IIE_06112 [Bacillus cereus VD045]|nr:hypothetical protein IIE_06112 [Bacillus cereus VD045]